ncbi:MAG: chromosomal replication initiator protein DnaA [Puniceicoccales bacterium]|jgi:chromosomal replication initiator protein|nr:chromosomal replication initiator protein DnaA [Puniceicoccales bacterium]
MVKIIHTSQLQKCEQLSENSGEVGVNSSIWESVKADFSNIFPSDVHRTWFEPIVVLKESEDAIVLGVQNDFAIIWIQENYLDVIAKKLNTAAGHRIDVTLRVTGNGGAQTQSAEKSTQQQKRRTESRAMEICPLNPKNTFENFVVGSGSQMAHAACVAVASTPGRAYNPLFLYGDTGLGKTHLMQAVAHQILKQTSRAHVVYTSTEKFTNEFINALQQNNLPRFRQKYRGIDVLLIDDIHFLSGKERIQEEFFHTFNELFESQKQILLCSDRPASEIAKLESRLVSRFQWGLVTDIQAPDFETRMAILAKKAAAINLRLPQDVIECLANRVSSNVRKLEGALTRLASYSSLTRAPINIEAAEHLLHDIFHEESSVQVSVAHVQQKVAEYYRLKLADMVSKRRPANIAFPRQVAMYLCRVMTTQSLSDIGNEFGGRDHGTVIHACKTVENVIDQDASVRRTVDYLQKLITNSR